MIIFAKRLVSSTKVPKLVIAAEVPTKSFRMGEVSLTSFGKLTKNDAIRHLFQLLLF